MARSLQDLRILVVADDVLVRAGLATLLGEQPGSDVVGQVAVQADLLVELDAAHPDAVLWDLGWEPADGLERLAELAEELPPVVVLLPVAEDGLGAVEAWRAGARGLVLRNASGERLLAAVMAVARGNVVLDPDLADRLITAGLSFGPGERLHEELTPRELEVLQLLAEGLPNKAIARRLEISEHTVKYHVNGIMGKLGAQSRTEAVVRATQLGLILL